MTTKFSEKSGDELSQLFAEDVGQLVASDDTHGDAYENQDAIARRWTQHLRDKGILDEDERLCGDDVAIMMTQLKHARHAVGERDVDHLRDAVGYSSIGAACMLRDGFADEDEFLTGGDH